MTDARTDTVKEAVRARRYDDAWQVLRAPLLIGDDANAWNLARTALRAGARDGWSPPASRKIRLGLLCSYEGAELATHLELACRALGIEPEMYQAPYGQLEQEVLGGATALAEFEPTHVVIAPTTADLGFPELAADGEAVLAAEESRWRRLWEALASNFGARVVQHAFVVPDETPFGHLALRLPHSRPALVRELNARLGAAAGASVLLVDTERLASRIGKQQWFDPRLWHLARQPFGYAALPLLARETAAVLAADVGLAARCLVTDLDNTLWGGLVGEEGAEGVIVGDGADGEAFTAFQDYLLALRERGIVLAVASKNDLDVAREPFEHNPRMRLRASDFAAFVADWRRKPEQVAQIAEQLGLPLDSLVFVDDNPAECAEVAAALPSVDTIVLDVPPSEFVRTLAASLRFETSALAAEDVGRQRSYVARAEAESLRETSGSLEDFWRSLAMRSRVRTLAPETVDRAAQLTQKTNQFNLTLVRRSREEVERLRVEPGAICKTLELEDRFANHGIVGLAIAVRDPEDPETAVIDTLLLSCRVIGRTAEAHLLSHLGRDALDKGFKRLRGFYVDGPRNALVADMYPRLGFVASPDRDGWEYDLLANGPVESTFIMDID